MSLNTCININFPEVLALSKELGLAPIVVGAKLQVWQSRNNDYSRFPTSEELQSGINFTFKALQNIGENLNKVQNLWKKIPNKTEFWNKIQSDLQIPKEQIELLKQTEGNTIEEIVLNFAVNYSYTVEINTAKTSRVLEDTPTAITAYRDFEYEGERFTKGDELEFDGEYKEVYRRNGKQIKRVEFIEFAKKAEQIRTAIPTTYYSNLTVAGGTNYTENEISTPLITPSIKGHAQFSTDKGIGWFRSDEVVVNPVGDNIDEWGVYRGALGEGSKTRRILEVQSDLFQKGRDRKELVNTENYQVKPKQDKGADIIYNLNENENKQNQFLQLLNKDNNWVTFFIKSIIQDSAKKGYEKVLFPTGNTASKVEGHTTLEEFKKQKEDRLRELTTRFSVVNAQGAIIVTRDTKEVAETYLKEGYRIISSGEAKVNQNEINQLKQELERVETEGFGALKPIFKFYEENVTNVLKKQGFNPIVITDEYGNTWNEINLSNIQNNIFLSVNPLIIQFKNEIKLKKKEVSGLQKAIINKRVALANAKLGSSYYINYTQVGQSDNYTWEIVDKAQGQIKMFSVESPKIAPKVPIINELLYRSITPASYGNTKILKKAFISLFVGRNYQDFITTMKAWRAEKAVPNWATEITEEQYNKRDDAWRLSNGLSQRHNTFKFIGKGKLDKNRNLIPDSKGEDVYDFVNPQFENEALDMKKAVDSSNFVMGNYALSIGKDNTGHFLSYTDRWDLNLNNAVLQKIINATQKPFIVTGKMYHAASYDVNGELLFYYTHDISNKDIENYNREIQRVEDEAEFNGQPKEEVKTTPNDKLNSILLDFLAKYGISAEQVSKIASVRGYSPLAIADFTNKLIQWTKGNEKEIPEEAAHFILGMMPRNDLFARLMKLARKSDKFNEVNEVYSEIYNDEDKVVFETAGKLLADAFNNKFEQEAESFLSRTLRLVLNWVRQLFGKAQLSSLKEELEKEFGVLARGIMEGTVTDLSTANLGQGVYYSTEEAVKKTVESLKNRKAYLSKFTGGQDAETVKIRRSKLDADIKRLEKDASEETLINLGYKHLKESEKILNKKNFTPKDLNDVQLTISRLKALPQLFKKEELVLTNEQSAKVKNLADEILNLEKLWKQKMLQVGVAEARAQGYDLTEDELMQAVADIGWFKREELSIDTSHIPIMKVIYSIITEMKRERDAEYEAYKAQSDEFRKTKSFDHLLDSKGLLITETKGEFFKEEAREFRIFNAYLEKYKGNKNKIRIAYERMNNWYRDNVNYELTQEGLDLYNAAYEQRRAELINDDGTWDDENLEELNKWELDYNPNTGIAFANHTSGFVSGNNHWFTFLKQTPKKEWKNSEYDRVKDDPLYQFIIKSVKEAEEMVPHQMLIDVGNFDKVLHDMFFDLTNTDRTSFNALKKGVGDWLDNTFKTILTADDLEGTGKDIKDELGNTIDVVNAPSKTHLKGKNLLDIVDGFYSLALTYKHKEAVSPTVRVLYELLKVQDAVEINKAGKRVKKGDSVQLKPAGLHNAVDATYYHMQSELYNQIRLDNENINPTAKEEKEFKDALTQWEIERDLALKEGREVPPKPILKKVSAVKAVDALIDYTRILKLGLKPSSAITNLLVGFTSNYLYAARNKEFSDKHLNKATRLLLNNVARALTGKKVSNEIGEKIANLSIKMGIQNAVMEDQFKYQDKFSQFMFSMQTSGEFLIANQLMLAMMFKQTVVNLKGETKELFDAYDKNGEWNTKEFGTQPKWTDDKYKEDGLNTSEIRKFRNKFEELRKNRQGDYQSFIKGKSKVVGRVYHLFRTWLPRMVYQRFGQEQGDFKGRYKSYAAAWDKYREHPSKKFGGFLVNTLGVVLAKTVNIPILNKLGLNSLSELASEKYEMSLKEAGLSDLDIENMRENVRELQFIVYIILFTLILRSLSGDDDDKTLNYLINLNQRMYQDLTFFYVPTSTFSILRDILPVVSTLEDATEVVMQSTNFLETYESGFRKGDNKLLKEIGDVTPLWSSVNSTMSMLNSQFTGSSYKAK